MHIICPKNLLHQASSHVLRAVSNKTGSEVLDNVFMSATKVNGGALILRGYDMECGIETRISCEVIEEGELLIPARLLGDISAKLPEGDIKIKCDDNFKTVIEAGKTKFDFMTRPVDDFPNLPVVDAGMEFFMPQESLQKLIKQTIIAVSTDLSRPAFNGILFNAGENGIELVAIDGFRLAVARHAYDETMPQPANVFKLLIPGKALKMLLPILGIEDSLQIKMDSKQVEFNLGSVKLISRLLNNEFMKYENLLENSGNTNMIVNRHDLLAGLERMLLIMSVADRRLPIRMQTPDLNSMFIDVVSERGAAHEELTVSCKGDLIDIDYNPTYFTDALRVVDDEMVQINFAGNLGPCIIRPLEGNDYEFLILPLRR